MKHPSKRCTWEDGGQLNGCHRDHAMNLPDEDILESLDPRLQHVDRLLAAEAARIVAGAPAGLIHRVHAASAELLPLSRPRHAARYSSVARRAGLTVSFGRRLALAACMGLVFVGGMWAVSRETPASVPPDNQVAAVDRPDGFSAFLTPISDEEISDDRAVVSVIELGDAEFWAVEAELAALESVLQHR